MLTHGAHFWKKKKKKRSRAAGWAGPRSRQVSSGLSMPTLSRYSSYRDIGLGHAKIANMCTCLAKIIFWLTHTANDYKYGVLKKNYYLRKKKNWHLLRWNVLTRWCGWKQSSRACWAQPPAHSGPVPAAHVGSYPGKFSASARTSTVLGVFERIEAQTTVVYTRL